MVQLKSNNLDLALTPPLLQVKEEVIHVEANAETRMRLKELVTVTDSVQTLSQMEAAFNKGKMWGIVERLALDEGFLRG